MKKFLPSLLIILVFLAVGNKFVLADETSVNLIVKNDGDVVYSGNVTLLPAGTISISDSSGDPHDTNADSVLSVINSADTLSTEFNISNLIYYSSFGAFYLKCINVSESELCDNWQYKVNNISPSNGMDSEILSGGENVVLYFGDENKAPETPPARNGGGGGFMALSLNTNVPPVLSISNLTVSATTTTSTPPVSTPVITPTSTPLNTTIEEKPKFIDVEKEKTKIITKVENKIEKKVSKSTKSKVTKKEPQIIEIKNQTSTTILPARTSTLSAFLKFFKTLFDKIL